VQIKEALLVAIMHYGMNLFEEGIRAGGGTDDPVKQLSQNDCTPPQTYLVSVIWYLNTRIDNRCRTPVMQVYRCSADNPSGDVAGLARRTSRIESK